MGAETEQVLRSVFEQRVRRGKYPLASRVPCQERHMTSYARHACQ